MDKISIYQVDAFSNELFSGNPAAVCPLEKFLSDELMQSIAAENNLSETAFFVKNSKGYEIRWFTPAREVKLCGHATLATAYVIFRYFEQSADQIKFDSKSGPLYVRKIDNGIIQLNFPAIFPEKIELMSELSEALGAVPTSLYQSKQDFLAVYRHQDEILSIKPDFNQLLELDLRGVIVSSPGKQGEYDFVSRFFVPKCGVPEDPVTGSAHCILTPYWASVLDKTKLKAKQLSKRGGVLLCELEDNRVYLSGNASLYMQGEIFI
jgi:PhzF family phenazine biosynthesis protein